MKLNENLPLQCLISVALINVSGFENRPFGFIPFE